VFVKSTADGSASAFDYQEELYTLYIKGIEQGNKIEEKIVCSAISRVLSASGEWNEILACAHRTEMQIIISNTTEVGLQLVLENINQNPPASFPGKLLAFLAERYKAFKGTTESGMVIIPTELIPDNGKKLKAIVKELAEYNKLDEAFIKWLLTANHFCSSLVDRIVPGKPGAADSTAFEKQVGYADDLMTTCEVYRLWAIEGDEKVKSKLNFSVVDEGVIIAPDIEIYRELKLRLLNGTHTLSCGVAFLAQFETVKEAMDNQTMSGYSSNIMLKEIAMAIPYPIVYDVAQDFSLKVLDRFRNPYIKHLWLSITQQYSMKMRMRVVPVLLQYYRNFNQVPNGIALGFAAWILFMKAVKKDGDKYFGERRGELYHINDDQASYFYSQWQQHGEATIAHAILANENLLGSDLTSLYGFEHAVNMKLKSMLSVGVMQTLIDQKGIKN
jgi:tagaturonate reductase